MPAVTAIRRAIRDHADPARAALNRRYFKCGPGEYGEGDRFLGLTLPQVRALTRTYRAAPLGVLEQLLASPWHEERLLALLILVHQFRRGDVRLRRRITRLYMRGRRHVNNWDLVDCSAPTLLGQHGMGRGPILGRLVASRSIWDRRIAVLATFEDIKRGDFTVPLAVAAQLLDDPHDLIHKAVGWMLREVGKRDRRAEEAFLETHARRLPRTALRYAIERFPEPLRRRYLSVPRDVPAPAVSGRSRRTSVRPRDRQAG